MLDDFARILYAGALPNLGNSAPITGGFKQWVIGGAYIPSLSESGDLLLGRVGVEALTRAVSFDYDRFALAAHESRIVALSEREKFGAVGWPLLKQYYSAFFSAHAIMRSRGAGVVRIDGKQSRYITTTLQAYLGTKDTFPSGTYYYSTAKNDEDKSGELTVNFSMSEDGKGVHEGFWSVFVKYLETEARRAVETGLPDNQDFISHALEVKNSIMSGETVWLSKVRNEINYQHEHQSWMPLTKKSISNKSLPKSSTEYSLNARLDASKVKDPIKSFFCTCCYISELNLLIANRVAAKSKAGGTFGQRWARLVSLTSVEA